MDPPHPVNWSPTHSTGPQTLLSVMRIFQKCIFQKCIYLKCIFAKCTQLACLLSFAILFFSFFWPFHLFFCSTFSSVKRLQKYLDMKNEAGVFLSDQQKASYVIWLLAANSKPSWALIFPTFLSGIADIIFWGSQYFYILNLYSEYFYLATKKLHMLSAGGCQ